MARKSESRPDSGLGFQDSLKSFKVFPRRSEAIRVEKGSIVEKGSRKGRERGAKCRERVEKGAQSVEKVSRKGYKV